ncbi:hypothetical protein BCR32DRAFT_244727 [Anaeromyces robustus]|uniref:Uncharacterized protein n=1 Tax=Anaeromyces robustus TaxID=1754192 RepID=A0A1Y1X7E0_9FUNG|nr:hypothetical protein BCR32DRAFT_244727 [Anaeromyces robustus]|eukprot:ORX81677.1 hypothetical protein BCR32DRAFT_244727 [Anaeromyces robustus]
MDLKITLYLILFYVIVTKADNICNGRAYVQYPTNSWTMDSYLKDIGICRPYCKLEERGVVCEDSPRFEGKLNIPRKGECYSTVIKSGFIVACSIAPQRLYFKRGTNTSLKAFIKRGNPGTTYFECVYVDVKKNTKYEYGKNMISLCSGASKNGEKVSNEYFGNNKISIAGNIEKWVNNCYNGRNLSPLGKCNVGFENMFGAFGDNN